MDLILIVIILSIFFNFRERSSFIENDFHFRFDVCSLICGCMICQLNLRPF